MLCFLALTGGHLPRPWGLHTLHDLNRRAVSRLEKLCMVKQKGELSPFHLHWAGSRSLLLKRSSGLPKSEEGVVMFALILLLGSLHKHCYLTTRVMRWWLLLRALPECYAYCYYCSHGMQGQYGFLLYRKVSIALQAGSPERDASAGADLDLYSRKILCWKGQHSGILIPAQCRC